MPEARGAAHPRVLIRTQGLSAGHAGVPVIRDLDLEVRAGEVVALLGPNGAGKTTALFTIAGVLPVLSGSVEVFGDPAAGIAAHRLARRGLALLPEDRGLFSQLTVGEHLQLRRRRRGGIAEADVLQYFPALAPLRNRRAGLLSGGEQQMLALSCQFIAAPKALMLDEVSLGLAPVIVESLLPIVRQISQDLGIGVLLVEQHVAAALEIADRAQVLAHGRCVLSGDAPALLTDRALLEQAYLGGPDGSAVEEEEP